MRPEVEAVSAEPLLMQFAKAPLEGHVKTRMRPALSDAQACQLHTELLLHTARQLADAAGCRRELWVDTCPDHEVFLRCLTIGASAIRRQQGEDLGARMQRALADGLARHACVVLVGSDCPFLDREYLRSALAGLARHDLVLGPALDGGYVLIGARHNVPAVFRDVQWGTDGVFSQTLDLAEQAGLSVAVLEQRRESDRPSDLPVWLELRSG